MKLRIQKFNPQIDPQPYYVEGEVAYRKTLRRWMPSTFFIPSMSRLVLTTPVAGAFADAAPS